jgi:hypothetical protein
LTRSNFPYAQQNLAQYLSRPSSDFILFKMKIDDLVELTSSQPEKQLESVARVQDPVNTAPLPQLVEQDDLEDSDDLDESDDSEDDDDELAQSALSDELERSEFEPYTDDGKCLIYYITHPSPCFAKADSNQRIRTYLIHTRRGQRTP